VGGQTPREQNEGDDNETDERADDEAQQQGKAILVPPEILDQFHHTRMPRDAWCTARQKV
jgi:hypothetical protein